MPTWNEILAETGVTPGPIDLVRRKYLSRLHGLTGRNVILYYSGWMQRQDGSVHSIIHDGDINAFMTVIHGLDVAKGLDLVLHTPGGEIAAVEGIVSYLRKKFGMDIRCFVPQAAFSGGTMIACACREIYMGRHSSIGPIDPQFGPSAAYAVLDEFSRAAAEIKVRPETIPLWQAIFSKIPVGFLTECQQAVALSSELAQHWLETGMFAGQPGAARKAKEIVAHLNNHADTKTHSRHIDAEQARGFGLNILDLETAVGSDGKTSIQDAVLTVHHACINTFFQAPKLYKIIENQNGVGMFISGSSPTS